MATEERVTETQEIVAQTQEGLAETQAEMGTGPSSSVVKIPDEAGGWTAMAEVMFMRPSTSELDYAILDADDAKIVGPAEVLRVDTNYEPGFRIGVGYDLAGTGVDTKLVYTWLHTSFSDSVVEPSGFELFDTRTNRASGDDNDRHRADEARAKFEFDYDVVDLEVGQTFQAGGSAVEIRLFGGLRYASIDQVLEAVYTGGDFSQGSSDFTAVTSSLDLNGIGPRIGVGGSWDLGSGFSLFGHTAGTLLVADFEGFLDQRRNNQIIELNEDFEIRVVPVAELSLGVGWVNQLSWALLTLRGGYEVENWFNIVDHMRLPLAVWSNPNFDTSNTTDLSLDGFFFNANLEFF